MYDLKPQAGSLGVVPGFGLFRAHWGHRWRDLLSGTVMDHHEEEVQSLAPEGVQTTFRACMDEC